MKKILIYDVAADSGGAVTILNKYYEKYAKEKDVKVVFVLSLAEVDENQHIRVIKVPWVKRSWFHRLFCDSFYIQKLIKRYGVDEVISLQNIAISRCNVPQTVYVQNALPFTDHKFSLSNERYLWIYKNIIGRLTKKSLKKADKIIVQTFWMRDAVSRKCKVPKDIIVVEKVNSSFNKPSSSRTDVGCCFFYPASCLKYKNHELIINACKELMKDSITDYRIVLTITENENKLASQICKTIKDYKLPIECVGRLNRDNMETYYNKSVLIFPSVLETVGLPLIEAKTFNAYILVADCEYARESIGNYSNVSFFNPEDYRMLASLMKQAINDSKIIHRE